MDSGRRALHGLFLMILLGEGLEKEDIAWIHNRFICSAFKVYAVHLCAA